ncbi:MAG: SDR family oxidoreductase [Anaerolineae bacterium]|nr:SDR family oxidoreductase [Anaerolineae bacterium]
MNNVALITGASSGIGLELARQFAKDNYDLVLVARRKEKLDALAAELSDQHGIEVMVLPKDLSDPAAPCEIHDELQQAGVEVEALVNNAGISVYGPLAESDCGKNLDVMQINVNALTHLTHLFLPAMVERGHGKIVNIGSTGSFAPGPLNSVYCATKAYVLSFTEAVAEELRGTGVTATVICPGATHTEFAGKYGVEDTPIFQHSMSAAQVAEIGYRAVRRGRRVVVTGFRNQLLAYSIPFAPRSIVARVSKRLMSNA